MHFLNLHLKEKSISVMLISFFFMIGCSAQHNLSLLLKEGDLLFQDLNCGPLCDAIEKVTTGVDHKSFSHCALVVKVNDSLKVVEAIGQGVQLNTLERFFARSGDSSMVRNITAGRLKKKYRKLIATAVRFAKTQVGKPYDQEFLMDNGSWYCSELIYAAFRYANHNKPFFLLEPMTFRDPSTHQIFGAWTDYYQKLNKPIPEGKPGINPGLLSRSPKISILPFPVMND